MAENLPAGHKTLGADKGYDTHDFVMELREIGITPHVAQNAYATETARRRSAIDGRTTRHEGYALSQKKRKRIEEIFGWLKTIGGVAANQVPRARPGPHGVYLRACRLQPRPYAEARGKNRMIEATATPARWETMSHSHPGTLTQRSEALAIALRQSKNSLTPATKSAPQRLFPQPASREPLRINNSLDSGSRHLMGAHTRKDVRH